MRRFQPSWFVKCLGYIIMKVMTVFFVIIVLRLVSSSNLDFFSKAYLSFSFYLEISINV